MWVLAEMSFPFGGWEEGGGGGGGGCHPPFKKWVKLI